MLSERERLERQVTLRAIMLTVVLIALVVAATHGVTADPGLANSSADLIFGAP